MPLAEQGYAPNFTQVQASQARYGFTPVQYSIPVVAQIQLSKARTKHKIYFYLEALEIDPDFSTAPTVIAFSLVFSRSGNPVFAMPIVQTGSTGSMGSNAVKPQASIAGLTTSNMSTAAGISIVWAPVGADVYQDINPNQVIFLLPSFEASFNADTLTVTLAESLNVYGWKLWIGIISN